MIQLVSPMFPVSFEWFEVAVGWGFVAALVTGVAMSWAFPTDRRKLNDERDSDI
jgi:hypothetical protein